MSESGKANLDLMVDRFLREDLSPAEARELAQASLDSPEVFDELADSAAVKAALTAETVARPRMVSFPRKVWIGAAGLAAALAIVFLSRSPTSVRPKETAHPAVKPALPGSAAPGQPILLAIGLEPPAAHGNAPIFRGADAATRVPRANGSILLIEDGLATIDLGSVDGLAKGAELRVFGDEQSTQPIGVLRVDTLFRERARGRVAAGSRIRVHQPVRVADEVHLNALLEQVEALRGAGNAAQARALAEAALQFAEAQKMVPAAKRRANDVLAALEHQAGEWSSAEKHYQAAVDALEADPQAAGAERCAAWNRLAVVRMLLGKHDVAEPLLNRAIASAGKTGIAYAQSANNLGVLAEMRGDPKKAALLYAAALPATPLPERRAVEANLNRVRSER